MRVASEFVLRVCMILLGQDVLREKQQHIEQLLKERDLERAEITRAANQADEAEQQLARLNLEYDQVSLIFEIIFYFLFLIRSKFTKIFIFFCSCLFCSIDENARLNLKNNFH